MDVQPDTLLSCSRPKRAADDDSDMPEEDTLMTDQQKEEEAMIKHTFNFYLMGK